MTGVPMKLADYRRVEVEEHELEGQAKEIAPNLCTVVIPTLRLDVDAFAVVQALRAELDLIREIVVVVDGAVPDHRDIPTAFENYPLCVVATGHRVGCAAARNTGISFATGDVILFLDSDCQPQPGIIEAHLRRHVGPNVVAVAGLTEFSTDGSMIGQLVAGSAMLYAFAQAQHYNELWWSPSVNLSVKREALSSVQFDASFPKSGGGEDVFLGLQLQRAGKILGEPSAKVIHPIWRGWRNIFRRFFRWGWADSILTDKVANNPNIETPVILRELSLTALLLLSTIAAGLLYFTTGRAGVWLLPVGAILGGESALVLFGMRGGQTFLEALSDQAFCLVYDIGSTLGRMVPWRWKVLNKRVVYFEDQMIPLWENSQIGERGALLGMFVMLLLAFLV